ncbi:MAG: hypothetical protein HYS27_04850 [Deltaproteobacteria bacterium]|nr:hypothetical protein [Deltaproteobacteria bacterium]
MSHAARRLHGHAAAPLITVALVAAAAAPAAASERRFTYTYESLVLNPGSVEVEPWTTFRGGREGLYLRFDERIEIEIGVLENLQMAWYLNGKAVTEAAGGLLKKEVEFGGVSNEWKWKLLDPVADPVGLALYGEWTAAPSEAELEAKVIVDKRFGDLIAAANVVGEIEWELETPDEVAQELVLEVDGGLAYLVTPAFGLGLELRNHTEWGGAGFEHSVVYAGPTLSYAAERWWIAFSALPQVVDLGRLGSPQLQDLAHHERINARVLLGFDL